MASMHAGDAAAVTPFEIHAPEEALADLRNRLRRTRWPEPSPAPGWVQGTPLDRVRDLCAYWADGYDWRATETRLNRLPQFRTELDGLGIHFVHARHAAGSSRRFRSVHYWSEPARGGHFAAFEQPESFVAELRAGLLSLRATARLT